MQIDVAIRKLLVQLAANGRSAHTIAQYRRHLQLFARWCRDVAPCGGRIERLQHHDVAAFLASDLATKRPDGRRKKATAMNCLRATLRVFLRYCCESGITQDDPGRLVRHARCAAPPPRGLSEQDQGKLMHTLQQAEGPEAQRDYMIFHLMLQSGVRVGSAVALDVEDVDLDQQELEVRRAKGDRPDRVYLNSAITEHLRRYLKGRPPGPLFTARGERVSIRHVQRRFAQWLFKAGITQAASCHSLRHCFGMRVYQKTHDVLLAKEALRHRSISSTLVYARVDNDALRRALG